VSPDPNCRRCYGEGVYDANPGTCGDPDCYLCREPIYVKCECQHRDEKEDT